jgi:hypothetical protein
MISDELKKQAESLGVSVTNDSDPMEVLRQMIATKQAEQLPQLPEPEPVEYTSTTTVSVQTKFDHPRCQMTDEEIAEIERKEAAKEAWRSPTNVWPADSRKWVEYEKSLPKRVNSIANEKVDRLVKSGGGVLIIATPVAGFTANERSVAIVAKIHRAVMRGFHAVGRDEFLDHIKTDRCRSTTLFIHGINRHTHESVLKSVIDLLSNRMRRGKYTILEVGDTIRRAGAETKSTWPEGFNRITEQAELIEV